jgi:riboflavin transporter 2
MALLSGVFSANSSRKVYVDILAILFGISSWISINGLWVELPLLVERLPESWSLASYLSIIVQMANIGPITYGLIKWRSKGEIPVSGIIVLLLMVGITSSSLLVAFWHQTSYLGDLEHSTGLFVLVFFLSLVDCTSSVLFLPFMGIFRDIYLNSYLVGEGLSGFIPSIAALIQGVGGNPYCTNVTIQNETSGLLVRISSSTYYI